MPRTATIFQIFASSPSDVQPELQIVQNAVSEWNQLNGSDKGVMFEVVSGYTSVAPAFAERPQAVINNEIGDKYDIYIGIMWMAFGSDTGKAPSGTVEEFERAFKRFKSDKDVYIAFFFKVSAPADLREINGAEYQKVQDFKARVGKAGGFYSDFDSDDELRQGVARLLRQFVKKNEPQYYDNVGSDTQFSVSSESIVEGGSPQDTSTSESDVGWLEAQESLTDVSSRLTDHFDWITHQTESTNSVINDASHELEKLRSAGKVTISDMRPVVSRVSVAMLKAARALTERLPQLREDLRLLPEITQTFIDLADDFQHDPKEWQTFLDAASQAAEMLRGNEASMSSMVSEVRGLPRMTTQFNQSRRSYVDAHEQLMNEVRGAHIRLAAVLDKARAET